MAKRGRKYLMARGKVDRTRTYTPEEAIELLKSISYAQFDETVELHVRTNLDPRHADQQLRGVVVLPHGLGRKVTVLVFAEGEAARIAEEAGADVVGGDDLIKRIEGGFLDFDVALATREMMGKVSRLGRILGPRGLMPNPRAGTVIDAPDLPRAIGAAKQGRVEFRLDRTALLHLPIGKLSFPTKAILDNLAAAIDAIVKARPPGAKGQFIRAIAIASTMSPGIKLDLAATLSLPQMVAV